MISIIINFARCYFISALIAIIAFCLMLFIKWLIGNKNHENHKSEKRYLFKQENIKKFERILKYLKYCEGGINNEACRKCPNDQYCGMITDVIDNWKINICGEPVKKVEP